MKAQRIASLLLALAIVVPSLYSFTLPKARAQGFTQIFLTTTGTHTFTVPADWSSINSIECIGSGGSATGATATRGGGGGGGGSYAAIYNQALTPGSSISYTVQAGGAGSAAATTLSNNSSTIVLSCGGGGNSITNTAGTAGTATVGTVTTAGGAGGNATATANRPGGGGGGAAGPSGIGRVGGVGGTAAGGTGGGGGGSNGFNSTAGGTGVTGGAGGNGTLGYGGAATAAGVSGSGAGGAGSAASTNGLSGAMDISFDATHGAGGGGGGGGATTATNGGNATGYGGGAGGAGEGGVGLIGTGGTPGQGIIVLTYVSGTPSTQQVLTGRGNGVAGAVRFFGFGASSIAATTDSILPLVSAAGALTKLYVSVIAAPGAGTSDTIIIRKNGAATAMTCTISDPATSCTDSSDFVYLQPGDRLSYQVSNTSAAAPQVLVSAVYTPITPNDSLLMSRNAALSNSVASYCRVNDSAGTAQTTENSAAQVVLPAEDQYQDYLDNLYIYATTAPGTGKNWAFETRVNGTDFSPGCTVSDTNVICSDLNWSVIGSGYVLDLRATPTGTPAATGLNFGYRFRAGTFGNFLLMGGTITTSDSNSAVRYLPVSGGIQTTATESAVQEVVAAPMTVTRLLASGRINVTSPRTRLFTLRVNGADTALTCTVANSNAYCESATGISVSVNAGDLIDVSDTPSGTPSADTYVVSLEANMLTQSQTSPFSSASKFKVLGGLVKFVGGLVHFQ